MSKFRLGQLCVSQGSQSSGCGGGHRSKMGLALRPAATGTLIAVGLLTKEPACIGLIAHKVSCKLGQARAKRTESQTTKTGANEGKMRYPSEGALFQLGARPAGVAAAVTNHAAAAKCKYRKQAGNQPAGTAREPKACAHTRLAG